MTSPPARAASSPSPRSSPGGPRRGGGRLPDRDRSGCVAHCRDAAIAPYAILDGRRGGATAMAGSLCSEVAHLEPVFLQPAHRDVRARADPRGGARMRGCAHVSRWRASAPGSSPYHILVQRLPGLPERQAPSPRRAPPSRSRFLLPCSRSSASSPSSRWLTGRSGCWPRRFLLCSADVPSGHAAPPLVAAPPRIPCCGWPAPGWRSCCGSRPNPRPHQRHQAEPAGPTVGVAGARLAQRPLTARIRRLARGCRR